MINCDLQDQLHREGWMTAQEAEQKIQQEVRLRLDQDLTPQELQQRELDRQSLRLQFRQHLFEAGFPVEEVLDFLEGVDLSSMQGFEQTMEELVALVDVLWRRTFQLKRLEQIYGDLNQVLQTPKGPRLLREVLDEIFKNGGRYHVH